MTQAVTTHSRTLWTRSNWRSGKQLSGPPKPTFQELSRQHHLLKWCWRDNFWDVRFGGPDNCFPERQLLLVHSVRLCVVTAWVITCTALVPHVQELVVLQITKRVEDLLVPAPGRDLKRPQVRVRHRPSY